jgi:hypothetical protein
MAIFSKSGKFNTETRDLSRRIVDAARELAAAEV